MAGFLFLVLLAGLITWGTAYSALHAPPSVSRVKIGFSYVLVLVFLAAMAGWRWLAGEEDLTGLSLLIYPAGTAGIAICALSILGTTFGIYRKRNSS